jgi:ubiquinone/menaquinone biosynthesis C-methylase UbiE
MPIFKSAGDKHALAIAMTGVKLGDRLLMVGCTDQTLLAAIGAKVGLSGRACAVVTSEAEAARARAGAERAGFLLELDTAPLGALPYPDASFDLVVIDNLNGAIANATPEQRVATLQHAKRTLAPRGRLVLIERAPRPGLGSLFRIAAPDPYYRRTGGALGALKAEGFRAVRHLAERDGLSFFEGIV